MAIHFFLYFCTVTTVHYEMIKPLTMKKELIFLSAGFMAATLGFAGNIHVKNFRYAGPMMIKQPIMVDSMDVNKKKFGPETVLYMPVDLEKAAQGKLYSGALVPTSDEDYAVHLLQFQLTNTGYAKANISVGKLKNYQIFVDGKKTDGSLNLIPSTHQVVIKYVSSKGEKDSLDVTVSSDQNNLIQVGTSEERPIALSDIMNGKRILSSAISYDGHYLLSCISDQINANQSSYRWKITDLKTGRTVLKTDKSIHWMQGSNSYYFDRVGDQGKELVKVDVATGKETILCQHFPDGYYTLSPQGDYVILEKQTEGPKDDRDVHQYVAPEDRQPGWRNRTSLEKYDFATGTTQPLTYGYHQVNLCDISKDGKYVLYMVSRPHLTSRPTTVYSLYRLNVQTMESEPIIENDGFIANGKFSPDAKYIAVIGSPECLNGIGKNVPEGRIPSMTDNQLYLVNCTNKKATPLTKYFNPCIDNFVWSSYDNKIYFNAFDRDYEHIYRINSKTLKIEQLPESEDMVYRFSVAEKAPVMAYVGQGVSNSDRLYTMNLTNKKSTVLEDVNTERLKNVTLGKCEPWNFVSSRGDTIYGRYYLPPHFDATHKYPMVVYYYGGCSPTSRYFESHYPGNLYAALGYVVYVVQPSGATGFGQEFASRHVNSAGEGPAQDIIEGTQKFCQAHPFVNVKKIGCIGASYGGFMTQYLQTKTDLFACAISHAGISDHTSYWGEGYWGYSYSEVSMANSYPWSNKDLFVNHSPLFNADKIHTPLLFLHGTADTNVPIGESIQMYTALRLLNRPTAFVVVEGQNHHITDYNKRIKWQNTIFAWFAKWLQDDSTWWNSMYDKMPE